MSLNAAEVGDRRGAADGGHVAEIAIRERPQRLVLDRAQDVARRMRAHLDRHLRDARQRPAVGPVERRQVADHEDVRRAGNREVRQDLTRPARSSGTPSEAPSGDAATPAAQSTVAARIDSPPVDTRRATTSVTDGLGPDFDAEPLADPSRGRVAQRFGKGGEDRRPALEQDDARGARD